MNQTQKRLLHAANGQPYIIIPSRQARWLVEHGYMGVANVTGPDVADKHTPVHLTIKGESWCRGNEA